MLAPHPAFPPQCPLSLRFVASAQTQSHRKSDEVPGFLLGLVKAKSEPSPHPAGAPRLQGRACVTRAASALSG